MAGHSKWANIKHRKERQDAKRGKIFTKWIRELTVAARQGGGDPGSNPRLRLALDKALSANMSRDIIDRAVARGAGATEAVKPFLLYVTRLRASGQKLALRLLFSVPDCRRLRSSCGE